MVDQRCETQQNLIIQELLFSQEILDSLQNESHFLLHEIAGLVADLLVNILDFIRFS